MTFIADNPADSEKLTAAKILVVDDDVLNQRMMQVLLARDGYEVDLASNGLEAIEAVKRQKYSLVFMDLQMPVIDGIETSRRIREWENGDRHTFIVALTASYLPEKGQELFEAGIDNYVSKPFDVKHIRRLLKYSLNTPATNSSPAPSPTEAAPLDAILDVQKGIAQVGGDLDTYRELLGDFVQGLPRRLQIIQQAFAAQDLATLSLAAHNLNGIAASLGAWQLSENARKLDKESIDGYTEDIRHLIGEIQITGIKLIETSNEFFTTDRISFRTE